MEEGFFFPTRYYIFSAEFVKFGGNGHPRGKAAWKGIVFLPEQNCLRGSGTPL